MRRCSSLRTAEAGDCGSLKQRRHAARLGWHDRSQCYDQGTERCGPEGTGPGGFDQRKRGPLCWLRRTPTDLALGGLTGGQSRFLRVVSVAATRSHREACEPNVCAWMDGARSTDEDGTGSVSLGPSVTSVSHVYPPRHPPQDRCPPPTDGFLVCP